MADITNTGTTGLAGIDSFDPAIAGTAGSAGGRIKTGLHVNAEGDTVSRVGFTLQQVLGVPSASWGTESNRATRVFSEILT